MSCESYTLPAPCWRVSVLAVSYPFFRYTDYKTFEEAVEGLHQESYGERRVSLQKVDTFAERTRQRNG